MKRLKSILLDTGSYFATAIGYIGVLVAAGAAIIFIFSEGAGGDQEVLRDVFGFIAIVAIFVGGFVWLLILVCCGNDR